MEKKILYRLIELIIVFVSSCSLLMHSSHKKVRFRIFRITCDHFLAALSSYIKPTKHVLFQIIEVILCAKPFWVPCSALIFMNFLLFEDNLQLLGEWIFLFIWTFNTTHLGNYNNFQNIENICNLYWEIKKANHIEQRSIFQLIPSYWGSNPPTKLFYQMYNFNLYHQFCFLKDTLASDSFSTTCKRFSISYEEWWYSLSFVGSWYTIKHPFDWSKVPVIFLSKIISESFLSIVCLSRFNFLWK